MTREEAINKLNWALDNNTIEDVQSAYDYIIALKMAIKALEQEPRTGHWIEEKINEWSRKEFCSECGCPPPFEYVSNGDIYSACGYGVTNKTKYCPNCGARMVEPQESEVEDVD